MQVSPETLSELSVHLNKGGNVILLSNHQTEPDPLLARSIFLKKGYADLYNALTAVAGYRLACTVYIYIICIYIYIYIYILYIYYMYKCIYVYVYTYI